MVTFGQLAEHFPSIKETPFQLYSGILFTGPFCTSKSQISWRCWQGVTEKKKKKKTKPGDAVGFKVISKVKSREKAIDTFTTSNRMRVLQKYADFHFVEQMCPQALLEIQVSKLCRTLHTRVGQSIQQHVASIQILMPGYVLTPFLTTSVVYFINGGYL